MPMLVRIGEESYDHDFRRPLLQAAAIDEGVAAHISVGDQIHFTEIRIDRSVTHVMDREAPKFPEWLDRDDALCLTGCHSAFNKRAMALTLKFPRRARLYDIIDDLSYGRTGLEYGKFQVRDCLWRAICGSGIVLCAEMKTRYRRFHHLDNASEVRWIENSDRSGIVYVGSIDNRLDLDLLGRISESHVVSVYGRIHPHAGENKECIERLLSSGRIVMHGPYENGQLTEILSRYKIGLLPYKIKNVLTEYINPDKIYHYLNAGLSVISTDIPQARLFKNRISIVDDSSDLKSKIFTITSRMNQNIENYYTWSSRWKEMKILLEK